MTLLDRFLLTILLSYGIGVSLAEIRDWFVQRRALRVRLLTACGILTAPGSFPDEPRARNQLRRDVWQAKVAGITSRGPVGWVLR